MDWTMDWTMDWIMDSILDLILLESGRIYVSRSSNCPLFDYLLMFSVYMSAFKRSRQCIKIEQQG